MATIEVRPGPWQAPHEDPPGHFGLLVLNGIMLREVCVNQDWSGELLGEGDFLRPWLEDASSFVQARWEVLEPVRLAVLDAGFSAQLARYPGVIEELLDRALRRSRSLAVHAVVEGVHRIDHRLLLLFWHLAEQRGHRREGEIVVPIRLTHAQLARLIGARRPTVTTALRSLREAGQLRRAADGFWRLAGEPPEPRNLVEN